VPSSPSDSDTRPTTFGALHGQLTERHEKGDRPHLRGPDHVERSSRPGGQFRVDHRAQALPPAGRFRPGCHLAVCQGKTEEIQSYLTEIRGAEVSKDTISRITDAVIAEAIAWQNRPVDAPYSVVFRDAIFAKIRDGAVAIRPIYVAKAVTIDGERDVLGL
jgi:hypothetical protein